MRKVFIMKYILSIVLFILINPISVFSQNHDYIESPIKTYGIGNIEGAFFSHDESQIISFGARGLYFWDLSSGEIVRHIDTPGHYIWSAALSSNGKLILTGGEDNSAKLWDVKTGAITHTFKQNWHSVRKVSFTPDDTTAIVCNIDIYNNKTTLLFKLYDVNTGELKIIFPSDISSGVISIDFSPTEPLMITGRYNEKAEIWNYLTGELIHTFTHSQYNNGAAFSSDGRTIAVTSIQDIYIFNRSDFSVKDILYGHAAGVNSVVFSSDSSKLLSASADDTVILWDSISGQIIHVFQGHDKDINTGTLDAESAFFSLDETKVLTTGRDGSVKLWDTLSGEFIRLFDVPLDSLSATVSPNGHQILTKHMDNLKLWDRASGNLIHTFRGHTNSFQFWDAVFSPDGTKILSVSYKSAQLWDVDSGNFILNFEGLTNWVREGVISPDGSKAIFGQCGGGYVLADVSTGEVIKKNHDHVYTVNTLAFSPDGTKFLTGSDDKTAKLWNANTYELLHTFEHGSRVQSVVFSPDDTKILTTTANAAILWDIITKEEIYSFYLDKSDSFNTAYDAVFSIDGSKIVIGNDDGILHIWDISKKSLLNLYVGHTNGISSIQFLPDGETFLSNSYDGTSRLWKINPEHFAPNINNSTYFPDPHFLSYIQELMEASPEDEFTPLQAQYVKGVWPSNSEIQDLTGIEFFTEITSFGMTNTKVESIDLSFAPDIYLVRIRDNAFLKEINLSQNFNLEYIDCENNQLETLHLPNNSKLTKITCYDNKLKSLNVINQPLLFELLCYHNQMSTLTVINTPSLETISCEHNQIATLNLPYIPNLVSLSCQYNQLTQINVSQCPKLQYLDCSCNILTDISSLAHNDGIGEGDDINISFNRLKLDDWHHVLEIRERPGIERFVYSPQFDDNEFPFTYEFADTAVESWMLHD